MTDRPKAILNQNAFAEEPLEDKHLQQMVTARTQLLGPAAMLFYREPLHIVRAEGMWLYDHHNHAYLDAYNNVPVVGHCHPRVNEAITAQLQLQNTHSRYLHQQIHQYAERLLATLPSPPNMTNECAFVPTCSGSEANDLALRIARTVTGRLGVIVSECAYHGNTAACTEVSPSSYKQGQWPDTVVPVPLPGLDGKPCDAQFFTKAVEEAIATLKSRGYGCAALLVDAVFSSDGVCVAPENFLQDACAVVRKEGGLVIADEVQAGFARTGSSFWGFANHGITPDVITFGKPMANGYPSAGLLCPKTLLQPLAESTGYFNTFAGSAVAMAAANAVLDIIEDNQLQAHALNIGNTLQHLFAQLQSFCKNLGDVRGTGLYWGLDIINRRGQPDATQASWVINRMKGLGVLIGAAGKYGHTLKIRPPLVFNSSHAQLLNRALEQALTEAHQQFFNEVSL